MWILEERYLGRIREVLRRVDEGCVFECGVALHKQQVAVDVGEGTVDHLNVRSDLPHAAALVAGDFGFADDDVAWCVGGVFGVLVGIAEDFGNEPQRGLSGAGDVELVKQDLVIVGAVSLHAVHRRVPDLGPLDDDVARGRVLGALAPHRVRHVDIGLQDVVGEQPVDVVVQTVGFAVVVNLRVGDDDVARPLYMNAVDGEVLDRDVLQGYAAVTGSCRVDAFEQDAVAELRCAAFPGKGEVLDDDVRQDPLRGSYGRTRALVPDDGVVPPGPDDRDGVLG